MTLDEHLAACVPKSSGRTAMDARRALADAIRHDPSLADQAEARLATLPLAVTDKCFIARAHADALTKALNR